MQVPHRNFHIGFISWSYKVRVDIKVNDPSLLVPGLKISNMDPIHMCSDDNIERAVKLDPQIPRLPEVNKLTKSCPGITISSKLVPA